MRHLKNPAIIYTLLWCVYWLQGVAYTTGSLISQGCLSLLLFLSIIYTFKYLSSQNQSGTNKSLFVLFVALSFYGLIAYVVEGSVIHGLSGNSTPTIEWFKQVFMSVLPFFCYTYFFQQNFLTKKTLVLFIPLFLVVAIVAYYNGQQQMLKMAFDRYGVERTEVTNNAGYFVLSLVPMMIVLNKKIIFQYLGVFFCLILIMSAFKRGAILIAAVIFLLILWQNIKQASTSRKVFIILASIALLFSLYYMIDTLLSSSDYLVKRIEETRSGDSSGRDDTFDALWDFISTRDTIFGILLGNGVWATTKITWTAAHNDWLEVFIDMGLLGLFIFYRFIYSFFRETHNSHLSPSARHGLSLLFAIIFLKTFFSMSIFSMTFYEAALYGLCITNKFDKE